MILKQNNGIFQSIDHKPSFSHLEESKLNKQPGLALSTMTSAK
uniref:Uncharacterized protein n=1 Tax=Arundo donax TaxID=35708 RepID=A0A0A9BB36_ARUDO